MVDVVLHRVEAMPGTARYAVTFRGSHGDHSAVVQVDGTRLDVADASLPDGWMSGTPAFTALTAAVLAVHAARSTGPPVPALQDVEGGWDVSLGNVVLDGGVPTCTGHGAMTNDSGTWTCAECGARARYPG